MDELLRYAALYISKEDAAQSHCWIPYKASCVINLCRTAPLVGTAPSTRLSLWDAWLKELRSRHRRKRSITSAVCLDFS